MINYKHILKKEGMNLTSFAKHLGVSRPTMYKMMSDYQIGKLKSEPYKTIFDTFFLEERNCMEDLHYYVSKNGNLVVEIVENTAVNSNGTVIRSAETRGKRDIVVGKPIVTPATSWLHDDDEVYFSFYAAQPIILDEKQYYIVNEQDVKLIKRKGVDPLK